MNLELRSRGTSRPQELVDDGIEPLDFALGDGEQSSDITTQIGRRFPQSPFDELKMDVQGVERISDFVRYTGGQQCQCGHSFALDRLFGHPAVLGNIAQYNGIPDQILALGIRVLDILVQMKRSNVKIEESVLWIKDLDIPTDGGLVG